MERGETDGMVWYAHEDAPISTSVCQEFGEKVFENMDIISDEKDLFYLEAAEATVQTSTARVQNYFT